MTRAQTSASKSFVAVLQALHVADADNRSHARGNQENMCASSSDVSSAAVTEGPTLPAKSALPGAPLVARRCMPNPIFNYQEAPESVMDFSPQGLALVCEPIGDGKKMVRPLKKI